MSEPAVIDLGLDRPELEPEAALPSGWWRPYWRRVRRWMAAAATVAMAVSLGGAAGPADPPLQQVWTLPIAEQEGAWPLGDITTLDDRLYIATPSRLTAYRLADGRVDWEIPLDVMDGSLRISTVAGMVLVMGYLEGEGIEAVTAYDPDTGELRWRSPGVPFRMTDDRLVLFDESPEPGNPGQPGMALVDLDPRTGHVVGSVRLESSVRSEQLTWDSPDGARYLFDLNQKGVLTRYDLATGADAQRVQTPHDAWENQLRTEAGVLMVRASGGSSPNLLAAYDPATLVHLWTIPDGLYTTRCGALMCVSVDEQEGGEYVQAIDPRSGEARWTLDCSEPNPTGWCAVYVRELERANRLWVTETRPTGPDTSRSRSWVADSATGEPLTAPTDWNLRDQPEVATLLLTRQDEVVRPRGDGDGPVRIWWARSDVQLGAIEVLGAVTANDCRLHHPYLVCWTEGDGFAVWRFGA